MIPWAEWSKSNRYIAITGVLAFVILLAQAAGALGVLADLQPVATKNWTIVELDRRRNLRLVEQAQVVDTLNKSIGELSGQVHDLTESFAGDRVERIRFELSQMRFQRVQMQTQVDAAPGNVQLRAILAEMDASIEDKQAALRTAICATDGRVC